jgi:hypothetical protein
MAEQLVLDQRDGPAHEAARIVVGDAALGGGDDEIGGEGDGDEGAHRQQVKIEEQLGQAVPAAAPARQRNSEERAGQPEAALLAGRFGRRCVSSSHAC